MNKTKQFLLLTFLAFVSQTDFSFATVNFANKDIEKEIKNIYGKYEVVKQIYATLDSSDLTYIIRYGKMGRKEEGKFEYDGNNLYITLKKRGDLSLQGKFVHVATHALQFENGEIGFFKKPKNEWEAINFDIWDEAEAFLVTIQVADNSDYHNTAGNRSQTNLNDFKKMYENNGLERAAQWLKVINSTLSSNKQFNPSVDSEIFNSTYENKLGYKFFFRPYQLAKN